MKKESKEKEAPKEAPKGNMKVRKRPSKKEEVENGK